MGEVTKKTKTDLRGGQHPTWDDQVRLNPTKLNQTKTLIFLQQINLPVPEKKKLVIVQIYDEDAKRQELISECELDITKVLEEGEDDGNNKKKIFFGTFCLLLLFRLVSITLWRPRCR